MITRLYYYHTYFEKTSTLAATKIICNRRENDYEDMRWHLIEKVPGRRRWPWERHVSGIIISCCVMRVKLYGVEGKRNARLTFVPGEWGRIGWLSKATLRLDKKTRSSLWWRLTFIWSVIIHGGSGPPPSPTKHPTLPQPPTRSCHILLSVFFHFAIRAIVANIIANTKHLYNIYTMLDHQLSYLRRCDLLIYCF